MVVTAKGCATVVATIPRAARYADRVRLVRWKPARNAEDVSNEKKGFIFIEPRFLLRKRRG
jgi:hypothetical protein